MSKILALFSANTYPGRQTFYDLLFSMGRYSDHQIYYVNHLNRRLPRWVKKVNFDAVVFTHSITMCSDRNAYINNIARYKKLTEHITGRRVAMFQDEYFNTDLFVKFVNDLNIDIVFSVAPESEWTKIYNGINAKAKIYPMLTGYIEERQTLPREQLFALPRDIDVSYRVGWDTFSVVLGEFSCDKKRIAECFLDEKKDRLTAYNIDVKVGGQHYVLGDKWFEYLRRCRFVLGVESGAGIIDVDGSMRNEVIRYCAHNPQATWQEVYDLFVKDHDHTLNLFTLSPRHFEAIQTGVCQILYEGNYSGILKPNLHYVPLKKDHSNFDEILAIIADEEKRRWIVQRAYDDIITSGLYTYSWFADYFFNIVNPAVSLVSTSEKWWLIWSKFTLFLGLNCFVRPLNWLKRKNVLNFMKSKGALRPVLKLYYKARGLNDIPDGAK